MRSDDDDASGDKSGGERNAPLNQSLDLVREAQEALANSLRMSQTSIFDWKSFAKANAGLVDAGILPGLERDWFDLAPSRELMTQIGVFASETMSRFSQKWEGVLGAHSGFRVALEAGGSAGTYANLFEAHRKLLEGLPTQAGLIGLQQSIDPSQSSKALHNSLKAVKLAVSNTSKLMEHRDVAATLWPPVKSEALQALEASQEALHNVGLETIAASHPVFAGLMEFVTAEILSVEEDLNSVIEKLDSIQASINASDRLNYAAIILTVVSLVITVALWANPIDRSRPDTDLDLDAIVVDIFDRLAARAEGGEVGNQLLRDAPLRIEPSSKAKEICRVFKGSTVLVLSESGGWYLVETQSGQVEGIPLSGWLHRKHLSPQ